MALKKFNIKVTHTVEVWLDDAKINNEFNIEFREYFWNISELSEHAKYIAGLESAGLIGHDNFVEGYGDLQKLNCKVHVTDREERLV